VGAGGSRGKTWAHRRQDERADRRGADAALVRAGQQGRAIDLIVRGACMLPRQVPGTRQHPRALGHRALSGAFAGVLFPRGDDEELYLSSADWMNRNMLRRIELAWPVTDPVLRQRIIDECLVAYLHDGRDAWGWLRYREREATGQTVVVTVQTPDLM
jgi:polyphosphate kinase